MDFSSIPARKSLETSTFQAAGVMFSNNYCTQILLFVVHFVFLSAAKPTDQGEESVVLLLVVVDGGGDHFQRSHVQFFEV